MSIKLIILALIIANLTFGQDSLQNDARSNTQKTYVKKQKKSKKKYFFAKKEEKKNEKSNDELYKILLFTISIFVVVIIGKRLNASGTIQDERDLPNSQNIFSDAWKRIDGKNPKQEKKYWSGNWDWLLKSSSEQRREYYIKEYLKSEAWQRKRYIVLKRDNWKCVHCGSRATQVHHKRYAPINIGKEPIEWLESVCNPCHNSIHAKK